MTFQPTILKRGNLKISALVKPITIWWTEEQINFWLKNEHEILGKEYPRIQTTPYSIIEFPFDEFESLEMTDESAHEESFLVKESTIYFKWANRNLIPISTGGIAGSYKYPITLLGIQSPTSPEAKFYDYSAYTNYQFLKEDNCSLVRFLLKESNSYKSKFDEEDFSIAEYSNINLKQY